MKAPVGELEIYKFAQGACGSQVFSKLAAMA